MRATHKQRSALGSGTPPSTPRCWPARARKTREARRSLLFQERRGRGRRDDRGPRGQNRDGSGGRGSMEMDRDGG